jgi:hypothetical protein
MGATLTMLHKRPPAPDDKDHPVRLAWGVPVPEFAPEFEERFGLRLVEAYGSTDAGVPIYQPLDEPRRPGSCGRAIPQYDIAVVDNEDREVATGEVGESSANEPSLLADGYYGQPEATLASRRNLWFHTGDLVRRDAEGYVFYVGRTTDSIRRRGENISAFEVEEVVKLHPLVLDAAAYGVASELGEDEVMVAGVVRAGEVLAPVDLVAFCAERMARHMLPRYVDLVTELPRTPTEKVEKAVLRSRGITPRRGIARPRARRSDGAARRGRRAGRVASAGLTDVAPGGRRTGDPGVGCRDRGQAVEHRGVGGDGAVGHRVDVEEQVLGRADERVRAVVLVPDDRRERVEPLLVVAQEDELDLTRSPARLWST